MSKELKTNAIPQVAFWIIATIVYLATGDAMVYVVQIGVSLGFMLGSMLAYPAGMKAKGEIIKEVHGEDWVSDAVRGRYARTGRFN